MIKLLSFALAFISCSSQAGTNHTTTITNPVSNTDSSSIYSFKVEALDGSTIDFAAYKGKKIMIVNTASFCGNTPQYKDLEALYEKYKDKLVIVGFPANNFGAQEPGTNSEIKTFCTKNYGVTFPMAAKISVKGDDTAPIYLWLTHKDQNGVLDAEIKWNFNKFVISPDGKLLNYFGSGTKPDEADFLKSVGL